jgi:acyl carrier protein
MKQKSNVEALLVQEVAIMLNIPTSDISVDKPLHELGIDSLSFIELLVIIEKNFNVNLSESGITAEDFQSIRKLASHIEKIKQE